MNNNKAQLKRKRNEAQINGRDDKIKVYKPLLHFQYGGRGEGYLILSTTKIWQVTNILRKTR